MKRLFLIIALYPYLCFAQDMNIGVLYEKVFATKQEAEIGARLWKKQIQNSNYNISVDIKFYKNEKKIIEDYIKGTINYIVQEPTFYFENKVILDKYTDKKWVMNKSKNKLIKYYLIKNRNSKFSLNNFDTKNIYFSNEFEKIWFEKLLFENSKHPKKVLGKLKRVKKAKKLIYNIFFDENSIAIVEKDVYDTMRSLNPQIDSNVKIVKESQRIFFSGMGVIRKNLNGIKNISMSKLLKRMEKDPKDFDVLSFININKVYFLKNDSEIEPLYRFYKNYSLLKNRNSY